MRKAFIQVALHVALSIRLGVGLVVKKKKILWSDIVLKLSFLALAIAFPLTFLPVGIYIITYQLMYTFTHIFTYTLNLTCRDEKYIYSYK